MNYFPKRRVEFELYKSIHGEPSSYSSFKKYFDQMIEWGLEDKDPIVAYLECLIYEYENFYSMPEVFEFSHGKYSLKIAKSYRGGCVIVPSGEHTTFNFTCKIGTRTIVGSYYIAIDYDYDDDEARYERTGMKIEYDEIQVGTKRACH